MKKFGDLSGIVKNVRTGHLVGGHMRVRHFDPSWPIQKNPIEDSVGTVAVGYVVTPWGTWNYREVDWDIKTEKLANLAANKHSGEFDDAAVGEMLAELDDGETDLGLTGFDAAEIDGIIGDRDAGETGEVKFSEELGETNNYVVLYFRNETDWLQAQTVLELDSVYSKRRNGKPWAKGVGRVLPGPETIEKIRASSK